MNTRPELSTGAGYSGRYFHTEFNIWINNVSVQIFAFSPEAKCHECTDLV